MENIDKFYALSAPIRREIINLLSSCGQLTASAIAESFKVTPSAISQHLKVLLNSDLVEMHKQAQQRIYQLNIETVKELEEWANTLVNRLDEVTKVVDLKSTKRRSTQKE